MAVLSFEGKVNIAVQKVTEQYPNAKLYEADGQSSSGLTENPNDINRLRVVFQNENNTSVVIYDNELGEFSAPILQDYPWGGDIVIDWPVAMSLARACELKNEAGFTAPFATVALRNPLGPQKTNPFFIFGGLQGTAYIFVDVVTSKVHAGRL